MGFVKVVYSGFKLFDVIRGEWLVQKFADCVTLFYSLFKIHGYPSCLILEKFYHNIRTKLKRTYVLCYNERMKKIEKIEPTQIVLYRAGDQDVAVEVFLNNGDL